MESLRLVVLMSMSVLVQCLTVQLIHLLIVLIILVALLVDHVLLGTRNKAFTVWI